MTKKSPAKKLARLKREVRAKAASPPASHARPRFRVKYPLTWKSLALSGLKIAAVVALPFFVYVRASVYFYARLNWSPWLAVGGAIVLTLGVIALYATWLAQHVVRGKRASALARTIAVPSVAAWLLYSMLFLARVNAKSENVQSYYWSLHPVLRAAVSTVMIVDPSAVVTDMQRAPADYGRMGLPVNPTTRHYVQSDGWVHAVDIRTNGRSELRNVSLQLYFWAMGFSTLRHVGTADHLHVQIR
ncbi:MAG TPA: hypothetical protein VF483_09325 [Gemmatimonadaceae bacterium]